MVTHSSITTLPLTAAVGSTITANASFYKILQNAGQNILNGSASTTVGVKGELVAIQHNSTVVLSCTVANTTWVIKSSTGSFRMI